MSQLSQPLVMYLPDTRGVDVSRYGRGNLKIGEHVYTYSRMPGHPSRVALGHWPYEDDKRTPEQIRGTCPGATEECQRICYARRVVEDGCEQAAFPSVMSIWEHNTYSFLDVPPIPPDCRLLRLHVGGDFDTIRYIQQWITRLTERPDVRAWAYTRSWRVPELLPALEKLRALPNVQLFASMDRSHEDVPPISWRRAWIDGDPRAGVVHHIPAHTTAAELQQTTDGVKALICPEETKHVPNCEACGFCISRLRNDVVFLQH